MEAVRNFSVTNEKRVLVAKLMLAVLCFILFAPFVSNRFVSENKALTVDSPVLYSSTTESEDPTGSSSINDISIGMKQDGSGIEITGLEDDNSAGTWTKIFQKYKVVIAGIVGIATLTFFIFFVIYLLKVASSADNPTERKRAVQGLIWTFIATAICGALTTFVALAWNALK